MMERMTQRLVHRGPDGHSYSIEQGASLGHARLAILDPRPEGDQPMWNAEHTIAIVYNGEIYNYRRLREEEGFTCKTNTDTEVLLNLYERHGMDFVHRLRGMFAFGIYDARSQTWHLARDSGGIKPLFVAYPKGSLAFASEMRALLAAFDTKPAIHETALSLYLRLQYVPGPQTLCEGIESLSPGTILSWQHGKETRRSFTPTEHAEHMNTEIFKTTFPDTMDRVVAEHLISDKPVGLFLSGGMDSSILLHHMAAHTSHPVKTFTVRFEATEEEGAARFNADADLARKTAEHYGTDHQEIFLTADLYRSFYEDTARSLDQPNADSVSVAQFLLSREAKKHVDVVLSGAGGDECFGGYPRYRIARILQALRLVPAAARAVIASPFGYPGDVLKMQPGAALAERLLARSPAECAGIVRGDWFDPDATTRLFAERFAALPKVDPVTAFMEFDRMLWLVDESIRLSDATTMGSGLECRVPFVDPRILAAARSMPGSKHVTLTQTKALLKDAYRPLLPSHLFTLKKASFYPPLAKWLRREAAPLAEHMLTHPRIAEYFDTNQLRSLFEAHRRKEGYHLHALSSVIQLSYWFDTVYDA